MLRRSALVLAALAILAAGAPLHSSRVTRPPALFPMSELVQFANAGTGAAVQISSAVSQLLGVHFEADLPGNPTDFTRPPFAGILADLDKMPGAGTAAANADNGAPPAQATPRPASVNLTEGQVLTDAEHTFTGTGNPGDTVSILVESETGGGSLQLQGQKVGADGTWTFETDGLPRPDGTYTANVTVGDQTIVRKVTYNSGTTAAGTRVPGVSLTDGQVLKPEHTFTGTGNPGDKVYILVESASGGRNLELQGETVGADGTWSFATDGLARTDGTYQVEVVVGGQKFTRTVTYASGSSAATGQPAIATTETAPTFAPPAGFSVSTTAGTIFEDKQPVLTGTGKPGTKVEVNISHPRYGSSSLEVPVAQDGTWTLDLGQQSNLHQLIPGRYAVEVRDPMGGENPVKTSIDYRTPNAQPALTFNNDTGVYEVLTTSTPSFSGTAPAGSTVQVVIKTRGGSLTQSATAGADGTWTVDFGNMGNLGTLPPGLYTATATVAGTDLPARGHGFEIKSTGTAATTAATTTPPPGGFSIGTPTGTVFEDQQPVLTGTGKPGTRVEVAISHPRYGSHFLEVPVAEDGTWTLDLATQSNIHHLIPGRYAVEVRDPMGGENPVKTSIDYRTPNAQPALTFNNDGKVYEVLTGSTPSFSGTAPAGTTVQVEIKTRNSSMRQTATVNEDGTWTVDFGNMGNLGTLPPGLYTATATVAGTDLPARGHGFEIKSTGTAATTAATTTPPPGGFSIGTPTGTVFEDQQPVLTGTGKPGTRVEVAISHPRYGSHFLEVPVAEDGTWTLDLATQSNIHHLIPGRYAIEVRDPMGGENPLTTSIDVRTPNAQPALTFNNDGEVYEVQTVSAPSFSGQAPAGSTVQVEITMRGSSMRHAATAGEDGAWTVNFADLGNLGELVPGLYTATATVAGTDLPARGHGFEIRSPAPASPNVVDIANSPKTMISTVADAAGLGNTLRAGGAAVVATIASTGNSTGDDAFNMSLFNLGKNPVALKGEGAVFRPVSPQEQAALLKTLGPLLGTVKAGIVKAMGYCLEKLKRPPAAKEIYALADAKTQQQFAGARAILSASQRLFRAGGLNPDSDPLSYFHATRQWAVWAAEQRFDERTFGDALVEHTRKNAEAAGYKWTDALEKQARGIIPNRWLDVTKVLAGAGARLAG